MKTSLALCLVASIFALPSLARSSVDDCVRTARAHYNQTAGECAIQDATVRECIRTARAVHRVNKLACGD